MQNWSCNPYMQMMNMPKQYAPMMEMPQEKLESMYPRCFYRVYPEACRHIDRMHCKFGKMYTPNRRQLDEMIDSIDMKVGKDIDADYRDYDEAYDEQYDEQYDEEYNDEYDDRPIFVPGFHGGRRRFRRDIISIILLNELLRRRRPHHHHYGY